MTNDSSSRSSNAEHSAHVNSSSGLKASLHAQLQEIEQTITGLEPDDARQQALLKLGRFEDNLFSMLDSGAGNSLNLQRHSRLLTHIAEVGNLLYSNIDLDSLLQEIVQAIRHSLEFGAVVLYLIDDDSKQVRVVAHAGLDEEGRQLLEGAVYTWEDFAHLLQEQFRVGRCYLVPHDEFDWERDFEGPVYKATDNEASHESSGNPWHPDDALFVPIERGEGQILGILSVDEPLDGQRPGPETLRALEVIAQQAASAIENARLYEEAQQDIDERKRAEEVPARERDLLQALMDNVPDMIFFKDAKSRIVRSNRAHAQFLGFADPQEVVGKTDFDLFSPEDAPRFYEEEQGIIRSGQPIIDRVGQTPNLRSGELYWLSETKVPLVSETGQAMGLVGIARDITDRKRAEEELLRFKLGIERSADAVFLTDIDGTITFVNPAFQTIYGYSQEEAIGQTPRIIKSGVIPQEVYVEFWEKLLAKQVVAGEIVNKTKEGELVHIEGSNNPILDEDGNIVGFLSIHRDVTERKRAQAELERRSAQLQTAAEVSRAASSLLDPEELIQQVVDLVRERFKLYYAGLFLVDRTGEWTGEPNRWAVLRAGSGEAGRDMLEAGHKLEVGGESMIGWCVTNAQARIALDVGEEAGRFENPWLPETRSEMALPLISRGQVIGAMTIQSTQEAAFSDDDIVALQTMADQLAAAIENARLFEEQSRRADELATLNQVAVTINNSQSMQELLDALLETVVTALGYDAGLISLKDDATGNLVLSSHQGLPDSMLGLFEQQGLKGTFCELVFQTGETQAISDMRKEAAADVSGLIKHGLFSYVGIPLIYQDESLGTVCLFSHSVRDLSADKFSLLEAIGHQIGVGIENVRLLDETQKALQDARAAHQQYLRQEWQSFLISRQDREGLGFVLTQDGLKEAPQVWSPEIQLAIQSQQPVVVTDTEEYPSLGQDSDGDGDIPEFAIKARSALATPINLRGQVIGALDLFEPDQIREWTDDDLALVDAITPQVALAVENARLFEQAQVALTETEALYRASHRITTSNDLLQIYQILVDEMADRLGADQCQLTIFDQEEGYGEVIAEHRPTPDTDKALVPMASNPAYVILRDTKRPLVIEDVSAHPAFAHFQDEAGRRDIKSMLLVPIEFRGVLTASLEIDYINRHRAFGEDEVDFCQTLARQAAIAIDNIRAFEEQKETAQRLREMDKLKTQFLANMSHELRTPLNSIIGFSRVILKGIDGPLTEMQETDLTAIFNSGQHLLGLINDILDLSKIEAGKMELNFDETDLKPIIKGVMSSAVGLVKDKDIELEHSVPDDLPNIWADATRIRQVLLNLISNATKFTVEGKISVTADYDDEWVTLSVADSGEGIPEENLGSIFEEFTQVDGSTTRGVGGTGLGLPISRYFIEMHGGKITVESELGVGSIFTLTLPIHAYTQPELELGSDTFEEGSANPERRTVLAVDDDPGVISLYRRYLENEGYQVVGVTNSEEALDKASQIQPFAITLDVLMPTKDGWQVLRELKACSQTQHIPIIVCSIVSNEGLGFSLGAADYLVKPIMEEELLAALSHVDQKKEGEVEVLVIDDQADDILLIRRMLAAQHRYRVTEADGGQTGIDLVHKRKPDIVVLDLMMPEVDGFAVLEALKRDQETRNIPVVVITAKELTEEEQQQLSGRVEVLLRKGLFTQEELLEDLAKALSRIAANQSDS